MQFAPRIVYTKEEELERMMAAYGDSMMRMCYLYLRDVSLCEDAVQEAFLKAYRAMDSFRGESSEKTWLMRIAINVCRDFQRTPWYRFTDRWVKPEDLKGSSEPEMGDDTVSGAIMALPAKYKDVIVLRYYQGLSIKEIAQVLSLPPSTVSTRLSRARERLHSQLKGWYFDEE